VNERGRMCWQFNAFWHTGTRWILGSVDEEEEATEADDNDAAESLSVGDQVYTGQYYAVQNVLSPDQVIGSWRGLGYDSDVRVEVKEGFFESDRDKSSREAQERRERGEPPQVFRRPEDEPVGEFVPSDDDEEADEQPPVPSSSSKRKREEGTGEESNDGDPSC